MPSDICSVGLTEIPLIFGNISVFGHDNSSILQNFKQVIIIFIKSQDRYVLLVGQAESPTTIVGKTYFPSTNHSIKSKKKYSDKYCKSLQYPNIANENCLFHRIFRNKKVVGNVITT